LFLRVVKQCLRLPARPRARALPSLPAPNQPDEAAEQPVAAASHRLTRAADLTRIRLARLKSLSVGTQGFLVKVSTGQGGHGRFGSYVDFVRSALAGYRCDILELVIEDSKAFARMRFSGIHRGEFFGYRPASKPVEWLGSALFSFDGEKVADSWVLGDVHGSLQLLEKNANG
jgi:predicted ester cyclase